MLYGRHISLRMAMRNAILAIGFAPNVPMGRVESCTHGRTSYEMLYALESARLAQTLLSMLGIAISYLTTRT